MNVAESGMNQMYAGCFPQLNTLCFVELKQGGFQPLYLPSGISTIAGF